MKAVKNTQTKTQKEINISILNESHKFKIIPFKLDEHGNYFEVYGTRVTRNNKLSVICNLKSLKGSISNIKFNFESLDKDMRLRKYIEKQNQVEFVNKLSINYNNKNWFNIEENSFAPIGAKEFETDNSIIDKDGHVKIEILEETCILNNKITENFSEIPIYWYDKNVNQKYRTTIVVLEIITDILSKKFPSFKTQLHNLVVSELNKAELTNSNLEDISNLSKEELLNLYKKEHEELKSYKDNNPIKTFENFKVKHEELYKNNSIYKSRIDQYIYQTQFDYTIFNSDTTKLCNCVLKLGNFLLKISVIISNTTIVVLYFW